VKASPDAEALRADDRDAGPRPRAHVPANHKKGRRAVDLPQQRRVLGVAGDDEANAHRPRRLDLAQRLVAVRDAYRAPLERARDKLRQRLEGSRGAAVTVDQFAESARTDVLASDQAQPIEQLPIGQTARRFARRCHAFCPMRLSVPEINRAIFSLCFHHSSAAIIAMTGASSPWPKPQRTKGADAEASKAESDENRHK